MYSIKGKYAAALLMYGYFVHGVNALDAESGRVPAMRAVARRIRREVSGLVRYTLRMSSRRRTMDSALMRELCFGAKSLSVVLTWLL